MNFTHKELNSFHVVELYGRLDVTHSPEFERELQQQFDQGHHRLVIDMSGVDYISSAGLRAILVSAKTIKKLQGEIRFCGLIDLVAEVFTISGFQSMFKIFDTISAATSE